MTVAPSTEPASKTKLAAYLAGLMALTALSLSHAGARLPPGVPLLAGPEATPETMRDLLRFGKPVDDIRDAVGAAGLPWFLRRAGVTGRPTARDPDHVTIALTWKAKPLGRYLETVQRIDDDRTRVELAFEPADMPLLRRLVVKVDTTLDPVNLMRVMLTEHIRASIEGGGFRLERLRPSSLQSQAGGLFRALAPDTDRASDDFPLSDSEREEAAIRHAYAQEVTRAGAAAPNL